MARKPAFRLHDQEAGFQIATDGIILMRRIDVAKIEFNSEPPQRFRTSPAHDIEVRIAAAAVHEMREGTTIEAFVPRINGNNANAVPQEGFC